MTQKDRYLSTTEVLERLGLRSPTTIWELRRRDKAFPKPRRFGPMVVRFSENELERWINAQPVSDLYSEANDV